MQSECNCSTGELNFILNSRYEVGDIVTLKTGGSDLTVIDYCSECQGVEVVWSDSNGDLQFAGLPAAAIIAEGGSYEN